MKKFLVFAALMMPFAAQAQSEIKPSSNEPIEITADGSLEWNRNEKIFMARDNALAKQGDTSIKAETLTAHYRDGAGGGMDIHQVQAEQNVELKSKDSTAYGQKADYDLDKGVAIMTGDNLKMVSPDQTVTANERFEYWITEGKLNAIGNARAERKNEQGETSILEADTLSAILKDNAQGKRELESLEAINNVVITTLTEKVTGQKGFYNAKTNKATLSGGVVLHRGPNMLEGDRAEVDLNTNTSQLFGGPAMTATGGQVRGVFYPGTQKTEGQQKSNHKMNIVPPPLAIPLPNAKSESAEPRNLMTAPSSEQPTLVIE